MMKKIHQKIAQKIGALRKRGFTLIELLLVIGISAILMTTITFSALKYRNQQLLDTTAQQMVATIRDAQNRSMSQQDGLPWGIYFNNTTTDSFTVFSGASYAVSASNTRIYTSLNAPIEFSSPASGDQVEVNFAQLTGLPSGPASISITNGLNTASFSISSIGLVTYASSSISTVPGAPTIGTATADSGQATVAFSAPASDGGSAITSYTASSTPGGFTTSGSASPLVVTGLTNGTAYTFKVTATNAVGTSSASAASNSVTPTGVPGAPTIGTATAGNGQATVAFSAPASDGGSAITSYTASSTPGGFTASGSASPLVVTGLANGTAYTFKVTATNAVGTSSASAASNSATPFVSGGLVWAATSTIASSYPYGIAVDSSAVYVTGYDAGGGGQIRIESRQLATGTLNWSTNSDPTAGGDYGSEIETDGTTLYIAGEISTGSQDWRLEKHSTSTGALTYSTSSGIGSGDGALDIKYESGNGALYTVGRWAFSGFYGWGIERRVASTGALTWRATSISGCCSITEVPTAVTADSSFLYVAGYKYPGTAFERSIEKRSVAAGALVWSSSTFLGSGAHTSWEDITMDSNYLYVVGWAYDGISEGWQIEKRATSTGAIIWATSSNPSALRSDSAVGVTVDSAYVYVVGSDFSVSGTNTQWRIEKRNISDGSLVWATTTNPSSSYDAVYDIASDADYLYISGVDMTGGVERIRVEKRYK